MVVKAPSDGVDKAMASYLCPQCKTDVTAAVLAAQSEGTVIFRDANPLGRKRSGPSTVVVTCPNGHRNVYNVR
jgi:hypothetical protein